MFGIYRISYWQKGSPTHNGHTGALSSRVKRGGKHVQFKSKREAEKWAKDNAREGEELYVRKVSKPISS